LLYDREIDFNSSTEVVPGLRSERRLRVGFVGCGDHSFRNVYPALRYAPVELISVCDLDADRADAYRRQFGALHARTDHRDLLGDDLDAVFVVTGLVDGRTTHADIATDLLAGGLSTWTEKPPVNDLGEVDRLREAIAASGATYAVGFKKAFAPANRRMRTLMDRPEFGTLRTLSLRYPQPIPTLEQMSGSWAAAAFHDHLGHPTSLLRMLAGPTRALRYTRAGDGTGFVTLYLESGAVASLHLGPVIYRGGVGERTEANGDGASIVVDNGTVVTWIPHGNMPRYGRGPDFTDQPGVTRWEPEFSLGQLYNKGVFLLGYHDEIAHFCQAVLDGRPVEVGGLDYAEEFIRMYDAFRHGPDELVELC
jgi:predicted dehydrogenase